LVTGGFLIFDRLSCDIYLLAWEAAWLDCRSMMLWLRLGSCFGAAVSVQMSLARISDHYLMVVGLHTG